MKYWLHQEAETDLEQIIERYRNRFGASSVQTFLTEYERVRGLILQNPDLGTRASRGRRWYPMKAVPYMVVYRVQDDGVVILIIRHQHRNPRLGSRRN